MRLHRLTLAALVIASTLAVPRAQAPYTYAITGTRLVPVSAAPIESGTIVVRDGVIAAIGAQVAVPADAIRLDGRGLVVYPGLIDLGTRAGFDLPPAPRAENPQTTEDVERVKADFLLRAHLRAADHLNPAAPALARWAAAGVTTALATPYGGAINGQSALIATALPPDDPQIGALADERKTAPILKSPVALHVSFPERPAGGDAYPQSLMGAIAYVRQALLDAQHQAQLAQLADRARRGATAPPLGYRPALDALQPALSGRLPVAFEASSAREIQRVLDLSRAFTLDPIITGGQEADEVAADLKAANAKVIVSLNYPVRPVSLAPDADEPVRVLRQRAHAPAVAAGLHKAGVPFAFASAGLGDPKDFVKNAAKAVQAGLPKEVALRALTLGAATLAGVGDRLGSLEPGKIANLVVTDGDLFEEKTAIKHVFVSGRAVNLAAAEDREGGPRRPGDR